MDWDAIGKVGLQQGPLVLFCLVALWAGYKQKWIWARELDPLKAAIADRDRALADMTLDRNRWRDDLVTEFRESKKKLAELQERSERERRP